MASDSNTVSLGELQSSNQTTKASDSGLNFTRWLLDDGMIFTVSSHRGSSYHPSPSCTLITVTVNDDYNNDIFTMPCFSCSGFDSITDYQYVWRQRLAESLGSNPAILAAPDCPVAIAEHVLDAVLLPANDFHGTHSVDIYVYVEEDESDLDAIRAYEEEFGASGSGAIQPAFQIIRARDELKRSLEGDKAEKDWKESCDHHDCAICIDEIESVWDSIKLPCSHVFHDKCVLRWLHDNHTCPLCRFEMPIEACNRTN